jgi:hypothetical protein
MAGSYPTASGARDGGKESACDILGILRKYARDTHYGKKDVFELDALFGEEEPCRASLTTNSTG